MHYTPLVFSASEAHKKKWVVYKKDGTVILKLPHKKLKKEIHPALQYSLIFATFTDLAKSLSSLANSPTVKGKKSLRKEFDTEFEKYRNLILKAQKEGKWEPDYGNYVYDQHAGNLYLVAPEYWHRLGLVANTSKLLTDPKNKKTWQEIKNIFENSVVGVVGASVGGNLIEGICRELRPKHMKVADPDWIEITNLNRLVRGNMQWLSQSRASKEDPKNPFIFNRVNKAEFSAYMQYQIDPYMQWYVYNEGITQESIEQFLLGTDGEPKLDVLVEEVDDFPLKVAIRKACRKYKIPVLMISDFGHRPIGQFQDFAKNPKLPLGEVSDQEVEDALQAAMKSGNRKDIFTFVKTLCGEDFATDEFADWVNGEGEQPVSSLPQSGATAMISGGLGAKMVAWYLLGYKLPTRFVYDFKHFKAEISKD